MNRLSALSLVAALMLILSACGPRRGYEGPELPPEQISQIRFRSGQQVQISKYLVDKMDASRGIDVLPDVHEYQLEGRVEGAPRQCRVHTTFNSSGYRECAKKGYCDCFNYMTVYKRCAFPVWASACAGRFSSLPGRTYEVAMLLEGDRVRALVRDQQNPAGSAYGQCQVGQERTEVRDAYQGTGRGVAYQYGITTCGYFP